MGKGFAKIINIHRNKWGTKKYALQCLECNYIREVDIRGIENKTKCIKCSLNTFKLSKDKTYWIGKTQKGEEFWFDGDEKMIDYIKSWTWRKTTYGYFQNGKGEKLHRVIMETTDNNIYINHLKGNTWDNRKNNLTISDCLDNSKEKRLSVVNQSGITGLIKRGSKTEKWIGALKINGVGVNTSYKNRDEAIIDLLIAQKHYGFRHNVDLYYLIENIGKDRIEEVINNIERQIVKKVAQTIQSTNEFKLSKCGTYYDVYDNKEMCFQIDIADKNLVSQGKWFVAIERKHSKTYAQGTIVVNGKRKTQKLHRFLFGLIDAKYKHIFVSHKDGNELNNRRNNLEMTDVSGSGKVKPAKGYHVRENGTFRSSIVINGKTKSKTFPTKEEAIEWYNIKLQESLNSRLIFKSKEEVDNYIKRQRGD